MRSQKQSRTVTALTALVAVLLGALVGAAPATAAPPYVQDADITSIDFIEEEVESGTSAELRGTWSLPDHPATPAGFAIDLPAELQGLTDSFPLLDPEGEPMGQCTVTATQLYCDFDSAYLEAHPRNLQGSFNFWVEVTTEVTENTEVTYEIDDLRTSVTVSPPDNGPCPTCEWSGYDNYKFGMYDRESGIVEWHVEVETPPEGMDGDLAVTITDLGGENLELISEDTYLGGTNEFDESGYPDWSANGVPRDSYTVSDDGSTIDFTTQEGWVYVGVFYTRVTDGGKAGTYTNEATIEIEGTETVLVENEVTHQGGGADGSGDGVGDFQITKEVIWNSMPIDDITFDGTYTVTSPDEVVTEGEFTIADGATWTSPEFEEGSLVHVEEILPTQPANIDWAEPSLSENDFAIEGGATVEVTLTNEATLAMGSFSASKEITGDGAELVPENAEFTLEYRYAAGEGFEAGSGTLVLPADGTVVGSDPLPVGAELALTEAAPSEVDGATWGTPEVSPETLTVDRDEIVHVTVTNPITEIPEPSPEPSDESDELAATGTDIATPLTGAAMLSLLGGALLMTLRRRAKQ
ncbi:DUF5979 domain-containing protein [Microbacterium halotolerans]|uniref:DUF5979 domain-containing protein n=1 Tax=Microbacterium halotolerans TaxID=246613 RepID=UPI000E6A9F17|nr:DUF5979 domain-containing protein [Microbacterium halotolerans]